jgi:2,3,4,5-tetrahydropyridine-2-carboxylate N-succinyltransferase
LFLNKNSAKVGRFSANPLILDALVPLAFVLLAKYFHMNALKESVESAWEDRQLLNDNVIRDAIFEVIRLLDLGELRVAEKPAEDWIVNEWVKKAVILYFPLREMSVMEAGIFEFYDKIPLKKGFKELGVRVVPQAVARYGSYLSPGVIMMPSYVNIGAWVGRGSMIDTWATVGSCAQIGNQVHLSGGVGIGGVLEPVQASPVIIEDGCFIGSRCIVVEGVRVGREAVLGANVVLTKSTRIIDVSQESAPEYRGYIPERSVVIPGTITKSFPAGDYQVACALIIGKRKESTDLKTSLNDALRDYDLQT